MDACKRQQLDRPHNQQPSSCCMQEHNITHHLLHNYASEAHPRSEVISPHAVQGASLSRGAVPAGVGARGTLLERWSFAYSPLQPGSSGYCSRAATDVAAVYKRLVSWRRCDVVTVCDVRQSQRCACASASCSSGYCSRAATDVAAMYKRLVICLWCERYNCVNAKQHLVSEQSIACTTAASQQQRLLQEGSN
jgi:hypothetical protein